MQTASSRGPLKSQPQTGPSEYFQREIHLASSHSCCPVLYFLFWSPLQICFAVLCTTESCLWLMNKVTFVHEKKPLWVVLQSRRLQEARTSYWLIWWSQTQSPFKSPWFSIAFLHEPTMVIFSLSCFHLQTSYNNLGSGGRRREIICLGVFLFV